jgi:hypothetical protein
MTSHPVSLKFNLTLGLTAAFLAAASPIVAQSADGAKLEADPAKLEEQAKLAEQAKLEEMAKAEYQAKLAEEQAKAESQAKLEEARAADKTVFAGEKSPVQSSANPFKLDIVAPVMAAASDETSTVFQKETLPGLSEYLQKTLGDKVAGDDSRLLLDPSKLKLQEKSDVRVYFLGGETKYSNTLGFNTTGSGVFSGNPQLIFPDATSAVSTYDPANDPKRSSSAPLAPGDFVNLGRMDAGTLLDFFLISNGANGGSDVFSTNPSANKDGISHAIAFAYSMANSPLLVIGFEDLYSWDGADRDFNDLLFAIDIRPVDPRDLTATPEPAMATTLFGLLGLAMQRRARRSTATS